MIWVGMTFATFFIKISHPAFKNNHSFQSCSFLTILSFRPRRFLSMKSFHCWQQGRREGSLTFQESSHPFVFLGKKKKLDINLNNGPPRFLLKTCTTFIQLTNLFFCFFQLLLCHKQLIKLKCKFPIKSLIFILSIRTCHIIFFFKKNGRINNCIY